MANFLKRAFQKIWERKILSLVVLVIIGGGAYYGYQKFNLVQTQTSYVTQPAKKGMIVASVSGTGQVYASDQADVKSKVSGDVLSVEAKSGQELKAGDIIAKLDSSAAQKVLHNAQTALETAKLELDDFLSPPEELTLFQAENSVISARNNLDDLLSPPDPSDLLQAEGSVTQAQNSLTKLKFSQATNYQSALDAKDKAQDSLAKSFDDGFNDISNTFLDLPTVVTKLQDILYSYEIDQSEATVSGQDNITALLNLIAYSDRNDAQKFFDSAENDYAAARAKFDQNLADYKNATRYSSTDETETLLAETIGTTKAVAQAIQSEHNLLGYVADYRSNKSLSTFKNIAIYQSTLESYLSQTNGHLSTLLSVQSTIKNNKEAIASAERDIEEMKQNQPMDLADFERTLQEKQDALGKLKAGATDEEIQAARNTLKEKQLSLEKLKAGPSDLDVRAKKNSISDKQDAVNDAFDNLANYMIRAPFDGTVADIAIKKGNSLSSNAAAATMISDQKMAEITLNEIDIANVKEGQRSTLEFDSIDGLTLTGKVAEVDSIGTVSQGVVSYGVKIAFDLDDERVKPGMTVGATVITDSRQDVLIVPLGAVETTRAGSSVKILTDGQPQSQAVTLGLTNDTMAEITQGLQEGQEVITQTVTTGGTATANSSQGGASNGGAGAGALFRLGR